MTAGEAPRKFPRVLLEAFIAVALLGLGGYGLSMAQQQRPYLGDPLPLGSEALVPYRVLVAPNIPVIGLFLGSVCVADNRRGVVDLARNSSAVLQAGTRRPRVARSVLDRRVRLEPGVAAIDQAFSVLLAAVIAVALILKITMHEKREISRKKARKKYRPRSQMGVNARFSLSLSECRFYQKCFHLSS